jgi:hypothetical protein
MGCDCSFDGWICDAAAVARLRRHRPDRFRPHRQRDSGLTRDLELVGPVSSVADVTTRSPVA